MIVDALNYVEMAIQISEYSVRRGWRPSLVLVEPRKKALQRHDKAPRLQIAEPYDDKNFI